MMKACLQLIARRRGNPAPTCFGLNWPNRPTFPTCDYNPQRCGQDSTFTSEAHSGQADYKLGFAGTSIWLRAKRSAAIGTLTISPQSTGRHQWVSRYRRYVWSVSGRSSCVPLAPPGQSEDSAAAIAGMDARHTCSVFPLAGS